MSDHRGFSLIELMVVLAVIAIVATIAVPSFSALLQNSRLNSTTNSVLGALQMARSEAVTLRSSVKVCAANAAQTACDNSTNWKNGVLVMRSNSLLRAVQSAQTGVSVSASTKEVVYLGNGTTSAATVTLTGESGRTATILVNAIGQACIGSSGKCKQ